MDSKLCALAGGIVHHLTVQYPYQRTLKRTFFTFITAETVFIALQWNSNVNELLKRVVEFSSVYILTALLLKTVHNVYFRHRGIPAKFWFSATDWTFWKVYNSDAPHKVIADLHRELGPVIWLLFTAGDVIRIQPNHVVFNTTEALEDIYGRNTKCNKGDVYKKALNYSPPSVATETYTPVHSFNGSDKARHSFLRRLINPSFSPSALKALEITMNTYFEEFITGIDRRATDDGIVEMNEWFHNLTFDIAGALTLGQDFGALRSGDEHFFIKAIHQGFVIMSLLYPVPWLAEILSVIPIPKRIKDLRGKCREFTRNAVDKCLKHGDFKNSILQSLQRAREPETGEKLSFDDLVSNSNTLLVAGADTTAVSLTFALYYIVSIPKVWNRVSHEIRSRFKSEQEITGQSIATLSYLDSVICETLRIRPVAAANACRVTPPEGTTISGRYITGMTVVSCPTWAMLHDDRYFSNPDSFIPERWIESERGSETCIKDAWIPFQCGKWSCIGKPLAMMEMRVTLARLIWNFDLSLKDGQEEPAYDHKAMSAGKLLIKVQRCQSTSIRPLIH